MKWPRKVGCIARTYTDVFLEADIQVRLLLVKREVNAAMNGERKDVVVVLEDQCRSVSLQYTHYK